MSDITKLLKDLQAAKATLDEAQQAYLQAQSALANSPLLQEAGLQVIPTGTAKTRRVSSAKQVRVDAEAKRVIGEAGKDGIGESDIVKSLKDKFTEDKIKQTLKSREGKWFFKRGTKYYATPA